jgi:dolichol-phosphate mannosyltransferase
VTSAGRPALSLVIPTYNERTRLAELVDALFAVSDTAGLALEVIVVDDNSPDGTGELADALAQTRPMQVVHRSGKLGLGTAVVAGFAVARADTVGVMDADFSHPPSLVPAMMAVFTAERADVLVASRYIPGGSTPNWPFKRRLLSRIGCLLARGLSPIRDAASGFFLIRRDLATGVAIKAGGFKICIELVVRARPRKIVEIPYRFDDRELGESKMSLREAAGYLVQLKDLYGVRLGGQRSEPPQYRRLSSHEVAAVVAGSVRS